MTRRRRFAAGVRIGLLLAAVVVAGAEPARRLLRSWRARLAVQGHSMAPTLLDGDWLLVDPDAYVRRPARPGDLAIVRSGETREGLLLKRVVSTTEDGRVTVAGDAPDGAGHAHGAGPLPTSAIEGRPWFRYWPPERIGPVR